MRKLREIYFFIIFISGESHILVPHEFASYEAESNTSVAGLVSTLCGDMLLEVYVPISLASLSTASLLMFGLKTNIDLNCR